MDVIHFIFFVFLNLMLLLSARLIMNYLGGSNGSSERMILGTAILFFTLIILIEIAIGAIGVLNYPMLALVVILLTAGLVFHQRSGIFQIFKFKKEKSDEGNSNFYLAAAIFAPALTLFAFRFFDGLFQIPFDFDAIVYHLPIVADWIQEGSVLTPYYNAITVPLGHYPSNMELLYLWTVIPFSNDFFVDLINFPIYGFFVGGIYAVCRNFNFEKRISLITAGIALYMPVFMHQAGLIFVDLFFITTLVLAGFFIQEMLKRKDEVGDKILLGLALGLFVGTKYLGVIYVILPLLVFLWLNRKSEKYWKGFLAFFGALFVGGGFFYLRNWVESGSPFYPVGLSLGGLSIFPSYVGAGNLISGNNIWSHLGEIETYKQFANNFLLICDATGVLVVIGLFFSFFYVISRTIRREKLKQLWLPILLLGFSVFYLFTYIKAPYTYSDMVYNVRYMMPFLVVGIINWGYLMKVSDRYQRILFVVLLLAMARVFIYSIFSPGFKMILNFEILSMYGSYLTLFLGGLLIIFFILPTIRSLMGKLIMGFIAVAMLWTVINFAYVEREVITPYYADRWYPEENMFWGDLQAAFWFNDHDPLARIAYTGFCFHYHLFGRDLKREVDYVNVNSCLECSFSDYDEFKDSIRHDANPEDWVRNLEMLNKNYVVLRDNTLEYEWIKTMPGEFELMENFKNTYIFKIIRK